MRLALLVVLALATVLSAQEKREPVRGSAMIDGKPWPSATVHLLSRPLPQDERIGTADEPSATTDEKGRFTVQLLTGRQYTAWAVEELADNRYRASFPVERVIAGRPLELIADEPRTRHELSFLGFDEWRARGKVIARLLSRTDQRFVFETTLSTDEWLLPPMPGRSAGLEILCDGLPFFQWPATVDLTKAPARPMKMPSPRAVRFKVVDAAGQPVPAAVLALRTIDPDGERQHECPLSTTDKNGEAVTTLPIAANQSLQWINYAFSVRAPGLSPVGNIERIEIKADHDGSKDAPAMTLRLAAGPKHELRLSRGEQPFAAPVVCNTQGATAGDKPFQVTVDLLRHVVPDAGGRLQVLRLPHEGAIVLGTSDSLRRPDQLGLPLHPMALLGVVAAREEREQIAWDLDTLQALVLHVVTADGTPVDAAQLAILLDWGGHGAKRALSGLCTDRSGRIAVMIPADQQVIVAVWTSDGFALATGVTAPRDRAPLELRLEKVKTVPGWVVGKDGKPAAFAEVECHVSAGDRATASLATAIKIIEVTTDGDGTFQLPLFLGLQYSMRRVATATGDHFVKKDWTVGKDEPDELILDLGKQR